MRSRVSKRGYRWAANLPTCFWETGYLHPEHGTAWTRSGRAVRWGAREVLLAPRTTSKLHGQPLTLEVTAICRSVSSQVNNSSQNVDIRKAIYQLAGNQI